MVFFWMGCVAPRVKPCTGGGQPPRDLAEQFSDQAKKLIRATKRCTQTRDKSGNYVNDGAYFERYFNEQIAITGEYQMGKKVGRWIEYDEQGNKIADKFFVDGKETALP